MDYLDLSAGIERRVFIKGLGGLLSVGVLSALFGGCESCREQIAKRPTRRRIRAGSAAVDADLASYRAAVQAMKALPASDPRSWAAQAAIHGSAAGFNLCQHGTNHFFSWHRAYLMYFEKICQKLIGKADFGLPYWNWNQNPAIDSRFLDAASPLFQARNNTNLGSLWAVSTSALDPVFADTNFFTFSTQLEGTPHNTVHTTVGGIMGGGGSASDPIFWSHHCMVDYAWAKWNLELGRSNTNDAAWINQSWNHFVDQDGSPATTSAGLTTLMPLLTYQYESSAVGSNPAKAAPSSGAEFKKLEARIRKGANVRFQIARRVPLESKAAVPVAKPFVRTAPITAAEFAQVLTQQPAKEHLFASLSYASLPEVNDFVVRVFVNLPEASASTPTSHPNFAGSFAFFGTNGAHAHHGSEAAGPTFLVNLTDTLRRLRAREQLSDTTAIALSLVAVPLGDALAKPEAELKLEKLEIIVTPVIFN